MAGNDAEAEPAAGAWRRALAALANAEQRLLFAEVILEEANRRGTTVPARRREKGLAQLAAAGLLAADEEGGWRVDAPGLRALLAAPPVSRQPGSGDEIVDRFVRDGRIHTYPSKPGQRRHLLEWAARQAFSPSDVLTEAEATSRLERLAADTVSLRRYLVDAGLVRRSADGSAYRLAGTGDDVDTAAGNPDPAGRGAEPAKPSPAGRSGTAGNDDGDGDGAEEGHTSDGPAARAARAAGLQVAVTRHGPVSSLAEAAAARGIEPRDLVKTLVVRRGDDDYAFVLVPGDRTFSWPKLRALLGTNRLSMPDAAEAREVTGYERGTITPFGAARRVPVYADREMTGRRISIGGGAHGVGLTLDADAALRVLDATVADLSDAPDA